MTEISRLTPQIYLIRHGETEWSLTGQHTGRTDLPLTPHGEDEVREWGQRTCELAGLAKDAEVEPDLAECDYGDYDGMRSVDIHKERPDWNVFRDGSSNGESAADISARADCLIARLRTMTGQVALFSHGQFGAVLAARWIQLSIIKAEHFKLRTASLSILSCDPHHPEVSVIEWWNASPDEASRPDLDSNAGPPQPPKATRHSRMGKRRRRDSCGVIRRHIKRDHKNEN
jgi:broad specificity phosphatase PhoE